MKFLKFCYLFGFGADLVAGLIMLSPRLTAFLLDLEKANFDADYLYLSRLGASLMLGWTFLLLWGSFRPVERRMVLLLTLFPVLFGLLSASFLAAGSGFFPLERLSFLWAFYALIIPLFLSAFFQAEKEAKKSKS